METAVFDPAALADTPLERIESEITELAAHLAAAECRWLVLIAEFDRREGYGHWGCRSTAQWLNWRCGLSMPAAYERVRVGRALLDLPLTREAFSRGELSYSKARALTRVGTPESEADLLELAGSCTAAQLERVTTGAARVIDGIEREANRIHLERYCRYSWAEDGTLVVHARLAPEAGALFVKAMEAVEKSMAIADFDAESDSSAEESVDPSDPWAARAADALVRMAEASLCAEAPEHAPGRFVVNLHCDLPGLLGDEDGVAEIEGGPMLSSQTLEHLACDGECVRILERDGSPYDIGRKTPVVPRSMRRALKARDRHCRFPGCTQARWVDAHHITWWSRGGPTALSNLLLLCGFHHRAVHHRGFVVEGRDGDVSFSTPDGTPIPEVPDPLRAEGPGVVERNGQLGIGIGPSTLVPDWDGTVLGRWELSQAVECILQRRGLLN